MIVFSLAILDYGRAMSSNLDLVVNWLFVCFEHKITAHYATHQDRIQNKTISPLLNFLVLIYDLWFIGENDTFCKFTASQN